MHYPLEMHMVHKLFVQNGTETVSVSTGNVTLSKAAVIGIMFKYSDDGSDGPFMTKLLSVLSELTAPVKTITTDAVESTAAPAAQFNLMTDVFGSTLVGSSKYFTYNGSLTTPGCNEGISWFVMSTPMTMSPAQLNKFTTLLAVKQNNAVGFARGGDNRQIQPLNGRSVLASFPAPGATVLNFAISLSGLTALAFTETVQTAFKGVVASKAGVLASAVTITGYSDTTTRRSLRATALNVQYSIAVPSAAAAARVTSAVTLATSGSSPSMLAAMQTAIPAVTGVASATPVTTSAAPRVSVALATLAAAAMALAF